MENETKIEQKKSETSPIKDMEKNTEKIDTETNQNNENVEEIKKKATLLLLQGKRSIYIKDYQGAIVALSECCQLFNQIYSEQDDALGDPYFYYGKALLEVGRSESDVLGDQVQEEEKEDDEDEEEEEDEGVAEKSTSDSNDDKNFTSNENGINSEKNSESVNQEENKTVNENLEADSAEINDLQLSWEYLELAKLIYLKKAETCKETAIKLAETYLSLGENGLESENYTTAIEDIKQALEIQKKHLKEEDRRIAETYYQLGIAYSLVQDYDEAIESFKNAIHQLEKKISSLEMRKKIGDKKTEEEEKDAFYTMDGEINEIMVVIKDVDEKIKDMVECKNQVKAELLKQVYGGSENGASSSSAAPNNSSSIPATNISHLVRKKRKNEENEENPEKKTKAEN